LRFSWFCSQLKLRKNYFFESAARLSREIDFPSTKTLSIRPAGFFAPFFPLDADDAPVLNQHATRLDPIEFLWGDDRDVGYPDVGLATAATDKTSANINPNIFMRIPISK
jgi:hypothetical protein